MEESALNLDINKQAIDIPCPACKQKIPETIGRLKRDPKLICPKCKTPIQISAAQLRSAVDAIQKSLDSLRRTLKGFGK